MGVFSRTLCDWLLINPDFKESIWQWRLVLLEWLKGQMPAHRADLMFVPWLRNPTSDSSITGSALTEPSVPAMIFSVSQEEKQLQNAAIKLTSSAIKVARVQLCQGAVAHTRIIWQIQLLAAHSPALLMAMVKTPAPSLKYNLFYGKCSIFSPFFLPLPLFFLITVIDHREQIIHSGKFISSCCPVGKHLAVPSWKLSFLMDVSLPKAERLNKTSVCNFENYTAQRRIFFVRQV